MDRHIARDAAHARRRFLKTLLAASGASLAWPVLAERTERHRHDHDHHRHLAQPPLTRSEADYRVPALKLVRHDGTAAAFPDEMDDGRPVILDFMYTSCTTVCPLGSQVLSRVQGMLAGDPVHLMSISIDPEHDTPGRLAAYARKHAAGPGWHYYTGSVASSVAMQKAFNAYRGDKMNHAPLTLMRAAPGDKWLRLEGFATPEDVVREFRRLGKPA